MRPAIAYFQPISRGELSQLFGKEGNWDVIGTELSLMASDRHDHQAEAWFGSYLFVGFAQNGLAPILLPLASNGGTGSGLSYASFALTGLAAPILGSWADRTSRHRDLLVWGCFCAAACFLAMCLTSGGPAVIVWAGGAGLLPLGRYRGRSSAARRAFPAPSTMPIISTSASFANSLAPSRNRLLSFWWCG